MSGFIGWARGPDDHCDANACINRPLRLWPRGALTARRKFV